MAIEVISTIKPKNNGSFPIVEAKDVSVDENGTRLSEKLSNLGTPSVSTDFSVPTFDLAALGLVAVSLDGNETILQTDTTEIVSALEKGTIRFSLDVAVGEAVAPFSVMPNIACSSAEGAYMCTAVYDFNGKKLVTFIIQEGFVVVMASAFGEAQTESVATNIDLSKFDTSGQITETYADGSTKTTTIEFDADGNPVKITDGDGNVTTLTW